VKGYRPQLDSIRAIAVMAVLYCHFWSPDTELAELGVRLFFVMSGFLLTAILLRESAEAERVRIARGRVLFDFYLRRILRIWPAYYFALVAAVALGASSVQRTFVWHALFATNILLFREQQWYPAMTGHFWTLSVEEQFYFALPLAVLFLPRRLLKPFLLTCIVGAVLFRGIICLLGVPREFYLALPIAQFDALAGGAFLALTQHQGGLIRWQRLLAWSLPLAILADVAHVANAIYCTFVLAAYVVPMAALVSGADADTSGWLAALLSRRPLITLGRVSYGVYLYHLFVAAAVDALMTSRGEPVLPPGPVRFAVLSCLTIVAAAVSWRLLERPALSMRRHFRSATGGTIVPAAPTAL
jgi:peptidoglycan/LPS O-acetylase OafA/YrhL